MRFGLTPISETLQAAGRFDHVTVLRRLVLSSVVTAGTVAVAGGVSVVGLMVPHIMRLLIGSSPADQAAFRRLRR